MNTQEITTRDIGQCYVALTIGLTRAAQWYATVLDTSIAKEGEPDRQAVVVLCNHLQRCGAQARFLQAHMGRCVSDARLAYIRQTNHASNLKELARAGAIQKSALIDFVPEHLSARQVVPLQWPQGSPHTFTFTPEHPPLFFCHDLGAVHGLQLGIKLHGVLINDGGQFIAPHENVMKCILANGQGKMSPPPSMRRDFDLAIWFPGCTRPFRSRMRWESQLTQSRPGFEYQPTIARLAKKTTQFLLEALADAKKQGAHAPYLEPGYDLLLIGIMQLSSQPPVWQPILEIMRPRNGGRF